MKKLSSFSLLGICCLFLITGCKNKDVQPEYGVYQEPIQPSAIPADTGAEELAVEWKTDVGEGAKDGFAILKPGIGQQGILTADRQGVVTAVNPENGKTIWKTDLNKSIFAGVAVGDGIAIVGHDDGIVAALSAEDGSRLWQAAVNRQISSVAAIGRSRVVIRTADGQIIGLKADTGERAWTLERSKPELSMHGDATPVVTGDAVLIGLANGRLLAHNVVTGREYWETEISLSSGRNQIERLSDADTAPLVAGNHIYSAAYQGSIASLRLNDASVRWKTKVSTRLQLAISGNQLLSTESLGGVVALDSETGQVLWEQLRLQGRGISHPLVVQDRVLVGDAEGNLYSISLEDGALIDTLKIARGAVLSLLQWDNLIIAYTSEGEVSAVSLRKRLDL